jgi:hypothetical protein
VTGLLFKTLAAANPPKPPPTITTRGIDSRIPFALPRKRGSGRLDLRTDNGGTDNRDAPYWFVKTHLVVSLNFASASYTRQESVSLRVCWY